MKKHSCTSIVTYLKSIVTLIFFLFFMSNVTAQLQTSPLFTNGMVLQRETGILVWGSADAEDTVSVSLNGELSSSFADTDGNWMVSLPAMTAGGPYEMVISNNKENLTRANVYIGDVYIAAGQSNMEMTLSQADGGSAEAAAADNQTIREFKIPKTVSNEPVEDLPSASVWRPATSSYAGNFSAVGYYFTGDLQAEIGIPIGIINASYGGARIEAFMSEEMLGFDETFVILANGEQERQPTLIYNAMINPMVKKLPFKGFLWYQGESNADTREDALAYGDLVGSDLLAVLFVRLKF
ncbi:MAG: sialate O-acetylesterase [Bacteroidales bacterium]|jgi:sialate O-acetylesterase